MLESTRSAVEPVNTGGVILRKVTKRYGTKTSTPAAVADFDLDIEPGEFITFLGPSGCGKTTTLRMIAGFESISSGSIEVDGLDMTSVPPNMRPMSMVFQSYALFPHLSVRENIAYGLKIKKMPAARIADDIESILAIMNLSGLADRSPRELSGGQQQRVALARALVMRPKILLFDEPLSNLDAKLREQMRLEIRQLQRRLGITSIFVTHDQDEAMNMSDRIVVMSKGRIEQVAEPSVVYRHPESMFVADFVGKANFLDVEVQRMHDDGTAEVQVLGVTVRVPSHEDVRKEDPVQLLVRPESVRITIGSPDSRRAGVGTVLGSVFYGSSVEYEIETESGNLLVSIADPDVDRLIPTGCEVSIRLEENRTWLLPDLHA